ncbi:hypothetical protein NFI96_014174 [Prochilodus magdalenae]|nr:hypothetical protein NFI96_014174 [Prochilodus magdalenae]
MRMAAAACSAPSTLSSCTGKLHREPVKKSRDSRRRKAALLFLTNISLDGRPVLQLNDAALSGPELEASDLGSAAGELSPTASSCGTFTSLSPSGSCGGLSPAGALGLLTVPPILVLPSDSDYEHDVFSERESGSFSSQGNLLSPSSLQPTPLGPRKSPTLLSVQSCGSSLDSRPSSEVLTTTCLRCCGMASGAIHTRHPKSIAELKQFYKEEWSKIPPDRCAGCHIVKFADDTAVVGCITNSDESGYRQEVEHLEGWCRKNNLCINIKKTKEMIVDFRRGRHAHLPLHVGGSAVEVVSSYRYLGVHLSNNLTWSNNTSSLVRKAHQRLYFLRRLRRAGLGSSVLTSFYRCVVESVLCSSINVWHGSCSAADRKALQRVVKAAQRTRNLSGSPRPRSLKKVHFIKNMRQYDTRGSRIVLICAKRSLCAAFSVLPYGESFHISDPALNTQRRRHSSGGISTLEMFPGLEGVELGIYGRTVSYAQFLYPTNALVREKPPEIALQMPFSRNSIPRSLPPSRLNSTVGLDLGLDDTDYDPNLLSDPQWPCGKHKRVLIFASYMTTVIEYVKPSDLKKDMNETFKEKFPHIKLTLSKIRSLKREMRVVGEECCLQPVTIAMAFAYFEKLVLQGRLNKQNRKLVVAACLLLAAKISSDLKKQEVKQLIDKLEERFRISRRELISFEFTVLVALEMALYLPESKVMPHYRKLAQQP